MKWLSGALDAVKEFFKWRTQAEDPEVIRQKQIQDINSQLDFWREQRDKLMIGEIKDEEKHAIALGNITRSILKLRQKRRDLER